MVGFIIPVIKSRYGQKYGHIYRTNFGKLNTIVLDNLYGLDEILQYQQKDNRLAQMNQYTEELEATNEKLKQLLSIQRIVTDSVILCEIGRAHV